MNDYCPIVNATQELTDCADAWFLDEKYGCWCLEDVLYTPAAQVPKFQRLSIFVPRAYMSAPGVVAPEGRSGRYTAADAPVIFENNAAGYMQMPHVWLGGPRCFAEPYLAKGMVYVTCGCRGRESRNAADEPVGKAPLTLVDLKTAIRFLRHNRACLPGTMDRLISVGFSAGGAMSALLAVTGNHAAYDPYLERNGAFMDESDAVYAAQIYCPIVDLEHADLAYEWMFREDPVCEDSPAGPAETMTPFKKALSAELARRYTSYVNSLGLRHPVTGEPLTLTEDGRGGSFYAYLMTCLNESAGEFLTRLGQGRLPLRCTPEDYLAGRYTRLVPAPAPAADPAMHHAGPGMTAAKPEKPMGLGELLSRPPKGVPFPDMEPKLVEAPGIPKPWLVWDGTKACVGSLDDFVGNYRRRMKPCTSFDKLPMDSGENHLFGNQKADFVHFDPLIGEAIRAVADRFPEEAARYLPCYADCVDEELAERIRLTNPMRFIGTDEPADRASYYRVRVGAADADTSLSISMTLAVALTNAGYGPTDYAIVWDQPHCEADFPGDILDWIESICR